RPAKIDMGGMADRIDRRRVFAAWWKRRRYAFGKVYRIGTREFDRRDRSDLHHVARLVFRNDPAAAWNRLGWTCRRFCRRRGFARTSLGIFERRQSSHGHRDLDLALLVVPLVGRLAVFSRVQPP